MSSWTDVPRPIRDKYRKRVLDAADYVCHYCGGEATEVDHKKSVKEGGPMLDIDNMVAACRPCNASKGQYSAPRHLTRFFQRATTPLTPLWTSLSPTKRKPTESPFEPPESTR